jgi:hypothetical protein
MLNQIEGSLEFSQKVLEWIMRSQRAIPLWVRGAIQLCEVAKCKSARKGLGVHAQLKTFSFRENKKDFKYINIAYYRLHVICGHIYLLTYLHDHNNINTESKHDVTTIGE